MTLERGWLRRQAEKAGQSTHDWPDWMRREAGLPVCEHHWHLVDTVRAAGHVHDIWICTKCARCEARRWAARRASHGDYDRLAVMANGPGLGSIEEGTGERRTSRHDYLQGPDGAP